DDGQRSRNFDGNRRTFVRAKFLRRDGIINRKLVRPGHKFRTLQHHRAGTRARLSAGARLGRLYVELCRPHAASRARRHELVRFHRNAIRARDCGDDLWCDHAVRAGAGAKAVRRTRCVRNANRHTGSSLGCRDGLMIAFSTCWNSGRHTDGAEMLREIVDLGFDRVELGHGIRISLMPGIQQMYDKGKVKFSSLHNFCPLPLEVLSASPDCYQFSSAYRKERDRAVKQTFQTIDFAERLGAPFIIMHLGEVRMKPMTDSLIKLARRGELLSRKYIRAKIRAVEKREAASAMYLERVKDCLRRIVEYAAGKKVKFGIEGRRGYEEIPSERELPALLDELNSPQVGYWHDFGHIQIKENLAFLDHA